MVDHSWYCMLQDEMVEHLVDWDITEYSGIFKEEDIGVNALMRIHGIKTRCMWLTQRMILPREWNRRSIKSHGKLEKHALMVMMDYRVMGMNSFLMGIMWVMIFKTTPSLQHSKKRKWTRNWMKWVISRGNSRARAEWRWNKQVRWISWHGWWMDENDLKI